MVYTCNNCKSHETRYYCTVCDDFNLCVNCKDKDSHTHPMVKLGFALDNGSSPADKKQTNAQENYKRRASIQRYVQSLVHACQCRDANCRLPTLPNRQLNCQKMKRVLMHTKNCKTKSGCPLCKQLIALCCNHAKHCQETKCLVPFCSNIKHKIKQQQLQQRLQQLQLLRRRLDVMNTRPTGPVAAMQAGQQTSNVAKTTGIAMKPGVSTSNLPTLHQLGIGLIPGTQKPPALVLQMVKEVQEEIATQQALHLSYDKVTPGGGVGVGVGVDGQTGGVMPLPQMRRPLPVQIPNPSDTHLIPMDQWTAANRYQSNAVMQQNHNLARQQLQLMHQQQQQHRPQSMAMGAQMSRQPGVIGPVGQVGPQRSDIQQNHALQQLMQILRSPHTPDQQNQILQILKSNPPLMAAFIKQRQQPGQHGGGVGGPLGPNQPQQQQQQQQQPGLQHMMSQQQQPQPQHQAQPMAMGAQMPQQPGAPQQFMQILRSPYTPD